MGGFVRINGAILTAISDALRSKLAAYDEARGGAQIAPAHFANILRSFKVSGTGTVEQDTFDLDVWTHQISESILQEVADELKRIYGTTDLIPPAEFAPRIRALVVEGIKTENDHIVIPAPTITVTGDALVIAGEGAAKFVLCIDGKIVSRYGAESGSIEISATWAFGIGKNVSAFSLSESGICSAMSGALIYVYDELPDGGGGAGDGSGGGNTGGGGTHEHSYTVKNTDEAFLASPATCEDPAIYFYSCACGEKGTTPFTIGTALGHNYVDGVCTRCGATDPSDDTFIARYSEQQLLDLSLDDMPALEIGKGYYANDVYFVADGHGYDSETDEYTYAAPPSDTIITTEGNSGTPWYDPTWWGVTWEKDASSERYVTFRKEASEGGGSEGGDGGGNTGGDSGDGSAHTHTYSVKDTDKAYLWKKATCTEPARYFYTCSCGEKGNTVFSAGDALGHAYEDGVCKRCGHKLGVYCCAVCGAEYTSEYEALSCGKTENCPGYVPEMNTGYCTYCGNKLPEGGGTCINPDCIVNGGNDNTGTGKYYCTVCGAEYNSEPEAVNCGETVNCPGYSPEMSTGYCDECGQKLPEGGGGCTNPECITNGGTGGGSGETGGEFTCPVCGTKHPSEGDANSCDETVNCPGYVPEMNTGYCEKCGHKLTEGSFCNNPECSTNSEH